LFVLYRNRRDKEEIKTKEKMQAFSQGSWQLLHAPITPPFASPSPIRNLSSSPTPKKGKTTMNAGEDPRRSGRDSQHS